MLGMYLLHLLPTFACSNSLMKTQNDLLKVYNRGLTKSLRSLKFRTQRAWKLESWTKYLEQSIKNQVKLRMSRKI